MPEKLKNNLVEHLPLIFLIAASLLIGLLTVRAYGESWDELKFYKYADDALASYGAWLQKGEIIPFGNTYDNYGPAFVIIVQQTARALQRLFPGWLLSDLRHVLYVLFAQLGTISFYFIARRWLKPFTAIAATLLFVTQPVFWGHTFFSPKDIPFMTSFLASLALGFRAAGAIPQRNPGPAWGSLPCTDRRKILIVSGLWLISLVFITYGAGLIFSLISTTIRNAYASNGNGLAGSLLKSAASDFGTAPVEIYIRKGNLAFIWLQAGAFTASVGMITWFFARKFPALFRLFTPGLVLAAAALGLCTSTRILGPLAGLLVGIFMLKTHGKQAWPTLLLYVLIAQFIMYITWPYLWPNPAGRLVESLQVMSRYPWEGQLLFNGAYLSPSEVPWYYLPLLLGIQFTEPVWPLFFTGLGLGLWQWARTRRQGDLYTLLGVWMILPLAGLIVIRAPLYDNFRQIFFLLPPVFLLAGVGLEFILEKIPRGARFNQPLLWVITVALALLPGIWADLRLHPYQYTYYNSFIGGVGGAFRRFETDYWGISYREASLKLNQTAEPDAAIWVSGPAHLGQVYLRDDLRVYSGYENERLDTYDYVLSLTRYEADLKEYPEADIIFRVERDKAAFAVIKKPTHNR
ncbi:MAG: hypothetical protein JXA13_10665 [Anaerolineales bacterium]|nr:hypothetical protein [Anaerolineales bacterium]